MSIFAFLPLSSLPSPPPHVHSSPRCSLKPHLQRLVGHQNLSPSDAASALLYSISPEAAPAEVGAFLALLSAKGETSDEVSGIVSALHSRMVPVTVPFPCLDIVGTGGDGHSTVNISTAASIVAAAAGCKVSKHGNRSVSSKSGSADVLEELGVNIELGADGVQQCIEKTGIGFMYARKFHPAMGALAGVRKAMGIRTVLNVVGPLLSPVEAEYMVLGVYRRDLLRLMAEVLNGKGVKRAVVVCTEGVDEFSNTGVAEVIEVNNGKISEWMFDPVKEVGMKKVRIEDLKGGDAAFNASVIRRILGGEAEGAVADAIALNAGVGCFVYGLDNSIADGLKRARAHMANGTALLKLNEWADVSQGLK